MPDDLYIIGIEHVSGDAETLAKEMVSDGHSPGCQVSHISRQQNCQGKAQAPGVSFE